MDISGQGLLWFARPQLFFNCTLCPTGMQARKQRHMEVSLVFFSTFEPINITPQSIMQRNGVPMFYDTASSSGIEPSLYLCLAGNVLGRVPMLPCFVAGNKHPTLPHSIGSRQGAVADTRPGAGNGSRLYELSPWMWRYGRGQPRKVSVEDAEARRQERLSEARRRSAETVTSVVSHVRIRTYFPAKYVRIRLCTYRTYSYVLMYVFSVRIVRILAFVLKTVRSYSYVFL